MKTITLNIEEMDWRVLEDKLVDPEGWITGVVANHVRKQTNKIITAEHNRLIEDPAVETIPATKEGIMELYFAQEGYQTCAERAAARSDDD